VVVQGEPLDVRDGQLKVFGEVVVVATELVIVALELLKPADAGGVLGR
jgi:hypothetical protein